MQYSKIRKLCAKSKLELVEIAYCDITEWDENPTDQRIIEEIKWKLECAINNFDENYEEYTKRDFTNTRKFIQKLEGLLQ